MHPSDPELQSLADGQLGDADRRRLRLHVEECGPCAARLRNLESRDRRIAEWLAWLDHPVPRLDAESLMARVRRRSRRSGLLAAGLAALFAATAAAAVVVPGSPVQRLVERVIGEWRGGDPPQPSGARSPAPEPPALRRSGVSFVPRPELEIAFRGSQPEGAIRISLVETSEVRVREIGGASAYSLDPAELVIDNRSARGSYEILLPRSLRRARVRIGERVVFEKDGARISSAGSLDAAGTYVVPFAGDLERGS